MFSSCFLSYPTNHWQMDPSIQIQCNILSETHGGNNIYSTKNINTSNDSITLAVLFLPIFLDTLLGVQIIFIKTTGTIIQAVLLTLYCSGLNTVNNNLSNMNETQKQPTRFANDWCATTNVVSIPMP